MKLIKFHLQLIFWIVFANYIVQVPYNIHLHGFHKPNTRGAVLLGLAFLLFTIPIHCSLKEKGVAIQEP